jgi:hypothetical protein
VYTLPQPGVDGRVVNVSMFARKVLGVSVGVAVLGVAIALYVADWATSFPESIAAVRAPASVGGSQLTLETVAELGAKESPQHPTWVSYLIKSNGKWVRNPVFTVPANSVVHVTLYEFDSQTGLRNPFLSQVQGTIGGTMTVNGKTVNSIAPEEAAHTFAVPELGVFVPLPGITEAEEEKNACEAAPCEPSASAHNTITFSFRTGKKGVYRWQCFVPCAAGYIDGNGGPMQTLGYMDGFLKVV